MVFTSKFGELRLYLVQFSALMFEHFVKKYLLCLSSIKTENENISVFLEAESIRLDVLFRYDNDTLL